MLDITAEVTPAYVLDSYALLAYFQAEAGAPTVRTLFEAARDQQAALYLSLINAGEMYYLTYRERGPKWAEMLLKDLRRLPIVLCQATEERVFAAARLKAQYPISYADAFAISLAVEIGAALVTGDAEFRSAESIVKVLWLPDK